MDKETKLLANQAIDENVKDTTARQIIRYVMECELNGFDTIRPTNAHIAKKYGWTEHTVKEAIYRAKRSQFITTTGRDKSRTFELNVQFLKGKMGEVSARKPLKRRSTLLAELAEGLVEPDSKPDHLPDHLPDLQQGANNNSNSKVNNKGASVFVFDDFIVDVLAAAGYSSCKTNVADAKPSAEKALKSGKTKEDILKAAKNVKKYRETGDGRLHPTVRSPFQSTVFWRDYYADEDTVYVEQGNWGMQAQEWLKEVQNEKTE